VRLTDEELGRLYRDATRAPATRPECPDTEALVAAARGELASERRESVAAHVAACSTCAEEFRRLAAAGEGGLVLPFRRASAELAARRWRLAAVVAGVAAATLLVLRLAGPSAGERVAAAPSLNVPIVDLDPATVRRGATMPSRRTLSVARDAALVTLVLNLSGAPAPGEHALELRDASGARLWYGTGLVPTAYDTFTLTLPTALLDHGPVELRVLAPGVGEPRVVERYELELARAGPG
jgi:hypothetical protein